MRKRHGSSGRRKRGHVTAVVPALILVAGLLAWWSLTSSPGASPSVAEVAVAAERPASTPSPQSVSARATSSAPLPVAATRVPTRSVAVLPFLDEGVTGEPFFPDAVTQDLITALSQYGNLKVIGSPSSFHFRGSRESTSRIARELGVAHLLEGRVRHARDRVRLSVTLLDARDGHVVWSHHYDKPYDDLFALQDAVTRAVANALDAKRETAPGAVVQSERPASGNLAAWTAYQRGVALRNRNTEASLRQAIAAFREAIRRDRLYTAAYARLSSARAHLAKRFLHGVEAARTYARARDAAKSALTFDTNSALAHRARGYFVQVADLNFTRAATEYRHALQLAPNDPATRYGLGYSQATMGHNREAIDLARQALASDPLRGRWYSGLATYLAAVGELDAAREAVDTAMTLQPGVGDYVAQLAWIEVLRGDGQAALATAEREPPGLRHDFARVLALQLRPDHDTADLALTQFIADYKTIAAYRIAEIYALRRDPYDMFRWLDRARANRDAGIAKLLSDPIILSYRSDPRFALFCTKAGLPTITDAVAMK